LRWNIGVLLLHASPSVHIFFRTEDARHALKRAQPG
jgi:hypothetical protein